MSQSIWYRYRRGTYADYRDECTERNMRVMSTAIAEWAGEHGFYPPVVEVRPGGALSSSLDSWPTNPYSGRPAAPGSEPGDYRNLLLARGFGLRFELLNGHTGTRRPLPSNPEAPPEVA